jgi:hypothetical protein
MWPLKGGLNGPVHRASKPYGRSAAGSLDGSKQSVAVNLAGMRLPDAYHIWDAMEQQQMFGLCCAASITRLLGVLYHGEASKASTEVQVRCFLHRVVS